MSRTRWYYYYGLLAIVDAIVIVLTIQMYSGTVHSADRLIDATHDVESQARWLHLVQQRLLEASAPPSDLAQSADPAVERQRFELARQNLLAAFDSDSKPRSGVQAITAASHAVIEAGNRVFAEYERRAARRLDADPPGTGATTLGTATAELLEQVRGAIRTLDIALARNGSERDELLQWHQNDLQNFASLQRYLIAAVVLMLGGILWFGNRLHQTARALQAQRRRTDEERRERLAAIGELCASVAHGIRNPLAAIRSSATLTLKNGAMDEPSRDHLKDIVEESNRLGERITGLLKMAGATNSRREELDLNEIVHRAAEELKSEFVHRGLSLRSIIPDQPVIVRGDRPQLEQVLVELLSNAMDHSKAGGTVVLSCERRNGRTNQAIVRVEDQGRGVPEEIRARIFDLFFTTKPGGTGIGLATIKRYVTLHGGNIVLESGEPAGARFVVDLPLAGPSENPMPTIRREKDAACHAS